MDFFKWDYFERRDWYPFSSILFNEHFKNMIFKGCIISQHYDPPALIHLTDSLWLAPLIRTGVRTNPSSATAMFPSDGLLEKRLRSQCVQLFQGSFPTHALVFLQRGCSVNCFFVLRLLLAFLYLTYTDVPLVQAAAHLHTCACPPTHTNSICTET